MMPTALRRSGHCECGPGHHAAIPRADGKCRRLRLIAAPGADGVVYRTDIVIGADELATSQTGKVTFEVEVDGNGWQPAAASVGGLQVGYTETIGNTSYALFTSMLPDPT